MDTDTEENIRAEIADIKSIPYSDRTIEDKKRLNELEAEIRRRRHPQLQSGEFPSILFPLILDIIHHSLFISHY